MAHGVEGLVDQLGDVAEPLAQLLAVELVTVDSGAAAQPGDVELEAGEHLPQLVVDLARDARLLCSRTTCR